MADSTCDPIMSNVVLDRCSNWVELQDHSCSENDILKRKVSEFEYDDWYNTDSEFDSVSECGGKRRRVGTQLKHEILDLGCEWKECTYRDDHLDRFLRHVSNHIPDIGISIRDNNEVYVCQWKNCSYETDIGDDVSRHINYHSYHTKLKCIGSNDRKRIKLPKCCRDPEWRNIIELPSPLLCRWEECLKTFTNYQMYLYHVAVHIDGYPRGNKIAGGVDCKWTGCSGKYPSLYKLKDHVKCHTKEKVVACPDCGATFASKTKFHTHCQRQIPIEMQGFRCSHCNKLYPTEGILRDHVRLHVFNYKCSLCDMSCESPASLAKHIRYRHVSTRTFSCQLCTHAAKSQQDLDSHMSVHTNGPNFSCDVEGCLYKCKGAYTFDRHLEQVHGLGVRWYCCHVCPIKYRKSYRLTKHLIEAHQLQLPNGHKRFHYMQDQDGCYRPRMFRFEAVDEGNVVLDNVEETTLSDTKYKMMLNQTSPVLEIKFVEDNVEEMEIEQDLQEEISSNADRSISDAPHILISIDEIDAKGNIINREIVETRETTELPPSEEPPLILT